MTLVDCVKNYLVGKKIKVNYPFSFSSEYVSGEVVDVTLLHSTFVDDPDMINLHVKVDSGKIRLAEVELAQDFEFLGYR